MTGFTKEVDTVIYYVAGLIAEGVSQYRSEEREESRWEAKEFARSARLIARQTTIPYQQYESFKINTNQ
jgi:hypothetical protein